MFGGLPLKKNLIQNFEKLSKLMARNMNELWFSLIPVILPFRSHIWVPDLEVKELKKELGLILW